MYLVLSSRYSVLGTQQIKGNSPLGYSKSQHLQALPCLGPVCGNPGYGIVGEFMTYGVAFAQGIEVDREIAILDLVAAKALKTRKSAKEFLIRHGLLTKTGKLPRAYRT